jgi:hypothetical protein
VDSALIFGFLQSLLELKNVQLEYGDAVELGATTPVNDNRRQ